MKSGLLNLLQYKFIRLWQILDLLVSQQGFQHLISLNWWAFVKVTLIALPRKQIVLLAKRWKLKQIPLGVNSTPKKSEHSFPWTSSLASNNYQKFIHNGQKIFLLEVQRCRRFSQETASRKMHSICTWVTREQSCHVDMKTMKSCLKSVASRFNRKCHKNGLQAVSKCFNRRSNDSFLWKTFDETVYALETHEKRHKSVGMRGFIKQFRLRPWCLYTGKQQWKSWTRTWIPCCP